MSNTLSPRLQTAYDAVNVSGHLYARLLSQQALLRRSKSHVEHMSGTVYRPAEARDASLDSRGLPVSTVVDLRTAFWQGATARAAAQRTVSAVGMALSADALGVMGPQGMAHWGNHPLAVVMRAALPLRVAAWPSVLWNQNLLVQLHATWSGPMQGATLGSGFAEYVVGTGYHDRPDAPQVSPGYMVVAPPAFERFKSHGLLGIPERLLFHWARRLAAAAEAPAAGAEQSAAPTAQARGAHTLASACMLGAVALRLAAQAFRLPLCAVWGCELLLGGLVGVAHVAANHAMQLMVLAVQQLGAWGGIAEAPSRPMWQHLDAFRADHAAELSERLVTQQIQSHTRELAALRKVAPPAARGNARTGPAAAPATTDQPQGTSTAVPPVLPGLRHHRIMEQL